MTCKDIQNLLPAHEDGALTPEDAREVETHLASCGSCRKVREDLKKANLLVRGLRDVEPPSDFKQTIMNRVRQEVRPKPPFWQRIFFPLYIKIPVQAFAVIVISVLAFYIYRQDVPQLRDQGLPLPAAPTLEKRVIRTASSPPAKPQENHVLNGVNGRDKEETKPPEEQEAPTNISSPLPMPEVVMKAPAQNMGDEAKTAKEAIKKPYTMASPVLSADEGNKGYSTIAKHKGAPEVMPVIPGEKSQVCETGVCRAESSAVAEADRLPPVAAMPEPGEGLDLVLRVKDTDTALPALKGYVEKIDARHTDISIQAEKVVFTTELRPSEMNVFLTRLQALGDLQVHTPAEIPLDTQWVRIRVMIVQ